MDSLTREEFLGYLRDDLVHLYDAEHLRRSPLASLFGVANRFDASSALRGILTSAIQALRPQGDVPPQSRAWLPYESLFCCYVQRLSQQVVADQLAVSPRQLRREQRSALEMLADRLCAQLQSTPSLHQAAGPVEPTAGALAASTTAGEDLAWLRDRPPERPADYGEALLAVLDLVQPLASQHQVHLHVQTAEGLPRLDVHPAALNQVLLSLLATAIPQARGQEVSISAAAIDCAVRVDVEAQRPAIDSRALSSDDVASLDMARQLVQICAGTISVMEQDGAPLKVAVMLPAVGRLPVLVVDDNADALRLLQRYADGTRYRPIVVSDPEQAVNLAQSIRPHAIVLDVMMPQVDGWKVLGQLRQHPRTDRIPIVVCTILPHEALAFSLGASAFVRKPVTRRDFLAALDQFPATDRGCR